MEESLVLIADDDPVSRETLADLLLIDSYQVESVPNGAALFDFLEHTVPDVILLDVMMPRMNGFEVCRHLKSDPRWRHLPVVLVTALNDRESLIQGLEAGADEFLTKPVSGPELRARVRNMARLKRQYDTLQETLQVQEDMVRLAVHDMRSPLTTIFMHTHSLLFKSRFEADTWALDVINLEARHLDNLIDDLLIFLKREKDSLRLRFSDVDVKRVLNEAVQEIEMLAKAAEVDIRLFFPAEDIKISVDANLFRRVVDNLLRNVIKHSPPNSEIVVSLKCVDPAESASEKIVGPQGIRLTFSDQGRGIPMEDRQKIFEMIEIVNLKQRGVSNTDIGLAFCKLVLDQHGGNIFVTDNQPSGSLFVIDL